MQDVDDPNAASRHLVAWADLIAQPWRNGGGVTRQILSRRRDARGNGIPADVDDWDWRLSIADVDGAGPFSSFTGMTRILTIIEGASITLTVDGTVEELERHRPLRFDGAAETSATLPHGPIRDLNLIARTGTVEAGVSIEILAADRSRRFSDGQYCVLLEGRALLVTDADFPGAPGLALACYDTILGDGMNPPTISGDGIIAVVTVSASA